MRILTLLVVVAASSSIDAAAYPCSISVFSGHLRAGESYILGTATSDTVWLPPDISAVSDGPKFPGATALSPLSSARVGWVVTVQDAVGAAVGLLEPGSEVILVPWGYATHCGRRPWNEDEPWLEANEEGVFSAFLRSRSASIAGRPVLDVFLAWHQPYPGGNLLETEAFFSRASDSEWLTMQQYWSLVQVLPSYGEFASGGVDAASALLQWEEANPVLSHRFPAADIIGISRFHIPAR